MFRISRTLLILIGMTGVMAALGCGKNPYNLVYGHQRGGLFTSSPMKVGDLTQIVALGNMNPPGHVLPTDHMYFYYRTSLDDTVPRKVYAPAAGMVTEVHNGSGDQRITVVVNSRMEYYLDHVQSLSSIQIGTLVEAGQEIAKTGGAYGIDLGVVDSETTAGFVNPKRYPCTTLHAISAWSVLIPSVQDELLPKTTRAGDPGGTFVYDKAGSVAGNWYAEGTPETDQANTLGNSGKHLAIVYDNFVPTVIRVSFGKDLNGPLTGAYGVQSGVVAPENISTDSGTVCYELRTYNSITHQSDPAQVGYLLMKLVSADKLSVEVVETTTTTCSSTLSLSGSAKTYYR